MQGGLVWEGRLSTWSSSPAFEHLADEESCGDSSQDQKHDEQGHDRPEKQLLSEAV